MLQKGVFLFLLFFFPLAADLSEAEALYERAQASETLTAQGELLNEAVRTLPDEGAPELKAEVLTLLQEPGLASYYREKARPSTKSFWLSILLYFFAAATLALLFVSKRAAAGAATFSLCAFLFLLYGYYAAPLRAVVVEAVSLRGDPVEETRFFGEPLLSGARLELLEIDAEGKWALVRRESGEIGYVPSSKIRSLSE